MNRIFELYIYTAGDRSSIDFVFAQPIFSQLESTSRAYADAVAQLLDETGVWFHGRVVSRDDYKVLCI